MISLYKEVRSVLLGRMAIAEDGACRSLTEDDFQMPIGVSDGGLGVRILGLARRSKPFETEQNAKGVMDASVEAMFHSGRKLRLVQHPDVAACFIRYVLTKPAVITVEIRDGVPVVTAWSARGLTGWLSVRRALAVFAKNLPEGVALSGEKAPEPADAEKSGRELRKERKAAKKAAKKQAKLERRQARKHRGDAEPEIPAEDLDENEKTEQTPPETPDGETKEN